MDRFEELDKRRRTLLVESENLKKRRNEVSSQIAVLKKEKKDADALIKEMREVGERIKQFDEEIRTLDEQLHHLLLSIPNLPHESVPIGETEDDNVEIRNGATSPSLILNRNPIGI